MAKRGPKPKSTAITTWSPELAYAVGLITADGCLSKDGRHIDVTSKDRDQLETFNACIGISAPTSLKFSGTGASAYRVQFSDVNFYSFLQNIGLTPAKSKTLSKLSIPSRYFFDFARGYFDGDGCSFSYFDSRWQNSYRFYISFASSSPHFVNWFRECLKGLIGIHGYVNESAREGHFNLKYAKRESIQLSRAMYYAENLPFLKRKREKIITSLEIIERGARDRT